VTSQPPDEPEAPSRPARRPDGTPGPVPAAGEPQPEPPRRRSLLLQGAVPAVLALGLAVAAQLGTAPFVVALLAVQLLLVLSLLALLDTPAGLGAFLLAASAAGAADAAIVVDDGDIRALAGVVAVAFVASLLHQLGRRARTRVTESLSDTLVVVVLAVSTSCLLALRQLDGGVQMLQVVLAAAGAALLVARIGDRICARPVLVPGSTRGWPGLLLGLGAGVAAAVLLADAVAAGGGSDVTAAQAALLALVCVATAAAGDLAADLGAADIGSGRRDSRQVAALAPTGVLLPFALLAPIALVAGELVLR
jgi:hypothetical protein